MICRRSSRRIFERLEQRHLLAALVDLDSDGDLDILTDRGWHENVDTFGNFAVNEYPLSPFAAAADIDGDGDLDIAAVNGWRENTDGKGDFSVLHRIPVPAGAFASPIKLIDVGGDGDVDLVMYGRDRVLHFDNVDGLGTFELVDDFTVADHADVGDVDNDGRVDAVKLENRGIWVYRNTGTGEMERRLWHQGPDPVPGGRAVDRVRSVEFVDANSDGWLDIASVQGSVDSPGSLYLRTNDQTGNVAEHHHVESCWECRFHVGDFDQDGDPDYWVDVDGSTVWLRQNDGTGFFYPFPSVARFLADTDMLAAAGDINRDGRIDLLLKSYEWIDGVTGDLHEPGSTNTLPDPQPYMFSPRRIGTADNLLTSAVADLNANDTADLIVGNTSIEFWEYGHTPRIIAADVGFVRRVEAADMDGDGDSDVVFEADFALAWIENLGENRFGVPRTIDLSDRRLRHWELGDINRDGLTDVVTATSSRADRLVTLQINSGDGFQVVGIRLREQPLRELRALMIADVDGDHIDEVVVHYGRSRIGRTIWFDFENGQSGDEQFLSRYDMQWWRSGDLDNDGRMDLIGASYDGIFWYSAFSGRRQRISGEGHAFSLADVDQDGDLDVVGHLPNRVVWYENRNGKGEFSGVQTLGFAFVSMDVHVADYTGNGRVELIATYGYYGASRVTLLERRTTGDSNHDGIFNSSDLVAVFQRGEYDDGIHRNSTFETGDWNGDGEFDSTDIVFAFQAGTFVTAARESNLGSSGSGLGLDDENATKARSFVA